MYDSAGASKHDVLWSNVRSSIVASLLIVLCVSRIFNITPDWHILEWIVLGLSSILIIWIMIEVVRNIRKIRESGSYALPFTVEGSAYQ
jgi:chromate transport protein ChrA